MKPISAILLLCFLLSCAGSKKLRLESVPEFNAQTYWLSQQYNVEYEREDVNAVYVAKVGEITSTHYHLEVSLKDQPQVAYTIRIRRVDLAIDGFVSAKGDMLDVYLPLLSFPLFKGKVWTASLRAQEHPRRPVKEIPATFEVKDVVEFDYVANKKMPEEKKAFLIEMKLPDQTLSYHYIPPSKKFPGSSLIDLYLQMDLNNPNAPKMRSELLEFVR